MKYVRLLPLLLILTLFLATVAAAQDAPFARSPVLLDFRFQTFTIFQNDRDFDRTEPLFDEYGQSVGYVATALEPGLTVAPIPQVWLRYSARIGDAVWSRNDAEQRDPAGENGVLFQTREMYGHVGLFGTDLLAGYQLVEDPTRLFVSRYMGALAYAFPVAGNEFQLLAAQLPDSVYETTTATSPASELEYNNFERDRFLFGLSDEIPAGNWSVAPAVFVLWDKTEIERPLSIVNTAAALRADYRLWKLNLALAMQFGEHRGAGPNNRDVSRLAGAGQAQFGIYPGKWGFQTTVIGFSADDGDPNDTLNNAYVYSGKSLAASYFLSQNGLYDQYDSLDVRAAAQEAGLLLADQLISYQVFDPLRVFGIAGYSRVFNSTRLGDVDQTVAWEGDLGLRYNLYGNMVVFTVVGGGVWPGEAGAQLKNEIDRDYRDPIYYGMGNLEISFHGL